MFSGGNVMDNKIEMYKEMVLRGEKLEKEQAMELLTVVNCTPCQGHFELV